MRKTFSNFTKLSKFSIRKRLLKERSKKLRGKGRKEGGGREKTKYTYNVINTKENVLPAREYTHTHTLT